jgi:hypothetical protein
MLNVKLTTHHVIFAKVHLINDVASTSPRHRKHIFLHHVLFHLAKLSLVRSTFLCRNHIKIQIFCGTFIFHKYFFKYLVWSFTCIFLGIVEKEFRWVVHVVTSSMPDHSPSWSIYAEIRDLLHTRLRVFSDSNTFYEWSCPQFLIYLKK